MERLSPKWWRRFAVVLAICAVGSAAANPVELYQRFLDRSGGGDIPLRLPSMASERAAFGRHLQAAERHLAAGRHALAARELEQAESAHPLSAGLRLALAELYLRTGRNDEAMARARTVLEERPKSAQPHDIIGNAYLAMGRDALALEEYGKLIAKSPDSPLGYRRLGDAYWALGRRQDALKSYENAIARDAKPAEAALKAAVILTGMGKHRDALERVRRVIVATPGNVLGQIVAGDVHSALDDAKAAEQAYLVAIKLEPRFFYPYQQLGALYAKRKEWSMAEPRLTRALALNPASLGAHEQLAALYRAQRKPALQHYHQGFMALAGGKLKEAVAEYETALRHDPTLKGAHLDLAVIHLRQNAARRAVQAAQKAVALDPEDAIALSLLGQAKMAAGEAGEAEALWKKVIASRPNYQPAYVHLGELLRLQGRCKEAVGYYERAAPLDRGRRDFYRGLAECYRTLGESEKAEKILRASPSR
jgi:tetratricopeptide (TPR) repeat protein